MNGFVRMMISFWMLLMVWTPNSAQGVKPADKHQRQADTYWKQAKELKKQGKYLEAAKLFEKSIEVEQASSQPRLADLAEEFFQAGYCYQEVGQYTNALVYYNQALDIDRKLGKTNKMIVHFYHIGVVYERQGQYPEALESYELALELSRKLERGVGIAIMLNNIGLLYYNWGKFDKALEYYEQSLQLNRKLGKEKGIANTLNNIGSVYDKWGDYDKALEYYEQSLQLNRKLGEKGIATTLSNIGVVYSTQGHYDKALEYCQQALSLSRKLGRETGVATDLNNIATIYHKWGHYDDAIRYFEQALEIARKLNRKSDMAIRLNNIGMVYNAWGQYDKALEYYQQALALNRKLGRETEISIVLDNIAGVYYNWGKYDNAIENYQQSLQIDRKLGRKEGVAITLSNIGLIYKTWGQYDKALDYYQQSLDLHRKSGREAEIASILNNMGLVYDKWGDSDKALGHYQQALELHRKSGREAEIATTLNNMGLIYYKWGDYDNALDYYQQSLNLHRKLGRKRGIATVLNNIGEVYNKRKKHDNALEYYQQALELARKLGEQSSIARYSHNIGAVYYTQKNYSDATSHFVESVDLLEKIRKTATGDIRRDYLASQMETYHFLLSCSVRTGDFASAFKTIELSRARLLAERLAGSDDVRVPPLEDIQHKLPKNTAVLVYANSDKLHMIRMIITQENIFALERSANDFLQRVMPSEHPTFEMIIEAYRTQLMSPLPGRGLIPEQHEQPIWDHTTKHDLSSSLYGFLIGDAQEQLHGKTKLIILPDGVLNFLPFETLKDEQGIYLVEHYQITYAQSLGVLELISQRQYAQDRSPLLAFGGAVYEEQTYQEEMIENEAQLASIQKQIDLALNRGRSLRTIYAQLGRGNWENLPGTLVEVNAIQDAVEGAECMTGKEVNETALKKLSNDGVLANYNALHFATHGDINPQIPELSALVLSSPPGSAGETPASGSMDLLSSSNAGETPALPGEEDGYLRAGELVNLNLKADFVNLSACETGLGKLYSGEGVVGLTQAFLLAGAKGLSVSLWSVADESTAQFMVAVYTLVEEEGLSYADAITEAKRRFIHGDFGDAWKAPYFWAPFVYYGK